LSYLSFALNIHIRLPSSYCPSSPQDSRFLSFLVSCVTLQRARRVPSQCTVLRCRTLSQRTTPPYSPQLSICPIGVAYHLLPSTISRPLSLSPALVGRRCFLVELCWGFCSPSPALTHPGRRSALGAVSPGCVCLRLIPPNHPLPRAPYIVHCAPLSLYHVR